MEDTPKDGDEIFDGVFSFDFKVYASLTPDQKKNALLVIEQIIKDETFKLQLEEHSPKKSESHFIE